MTKKDARNRAIDYLFAAYSCFYEIESKYIIDDAGTMSESGFTNEDCEIIEKELLFLIKKVLACKPKEKK